MSAKGTGGNDGKSGVGDPFTTIHNPSIAEAKEGAGRRPRRPRARHGQEGETKSDIERPHIKTIEGG